ncbi:nitrile hydratase accessory protein [Silicimonas algicola]|uniref:Nitrile hydratase accessory protein n=1 Tax=Silicimonas algicola TaxID=1826607 RepID=A0A316G7X3_9RHOB|nr:nitrile hydratase accessory protein [Silicimonas algicola]AZQ68847.1 nitrile hydratase accessory protein [Silicimonas algicola]PWK56066.1 nitrile hydratase accessory protein [Silicimonas algicola]
MIAPDDPFAPLGHRFAEPWHAQTLAAAHALVDEGHATPAQWADALGAALARAAVQGAPDTEDTYYLAALEALESLAPLDPAQLSDRKSEWRDAYLRTPHGQPVTL